MNLLNQLTIKNLKLNKKRTVVTIIGIMLSVALITAVASVYISGISSLIRYEAKQFGNFHIAYLDVPSDDLALIANNNAVKNYTLVRNIGYAKLNTQNEYKPYAYIKAFNDAALKELSVNLVEGEMPKNDKEILIPTHLKTNGRVVYNVGDEIKLNIGKRILDGYELNQFNPYQESEKLKDTKEYTFKIVGIMERPASNIEDYSAPGYTFITNDNSIVDGLYDIYTLYTKNGLKNFYEVTGNLLGVDGVKFKQCYENGDAYEDTSKFDECEALVSNVKYDVKTNDYLISLEKDPTNFMMGGGLGTVAIVVCIIIVFTSAFCIKNSFDISITEKVKQYGMLKSIGATQKQIKKNVFYEATVLGMFGIPLGLLLGFFASFILMIVSNLFVSELLGVELSFQFSWIATIFAIVLGVVTVYLSALSSARKASKVSPIESIRNSGEIKMNSKKIKSPKFIKKIFGIGGDISYKNLKRNKKKYRTTVISLAVSVFIFIALSSFMDIVFRSVKEDYKTNEYNLEITVSHFDDSIYNVLNEIVKDDSVIEYNIVKETGIEIANAPLTEKYIDYAYHVNEYTSFNLFALSNHQYKEYIKKLNLKYEDVKDKAIFMDTIIDKEYNEKTKKAEKVVFRETNYKKGDNIKGIVFDKDTNFDIALITSEKPFGYMNYEVTTFFIVSEEMFDKNYKPLSLDIFINTKDASKLQDKAEDALRSYTADITNSEEEYRMVNNLYILVGIFLYGFIIVISLIGITNIFNTITTNMALRKREFAMLKSVGMTSSEFNRMIRLESLFMGIKSLIYGILIGVILSYLVFISLDQEILKYHVPYKAIIISIVVVFMIISLIMKYSISKINKQNTIETIRNENI